MKLQKDPSNTIPTQIHLNNSAPAQDLMRPVINPPSFAQSDKDLLVWLMFCYRGDKPQGGLWTSTHTPDEEYSCAWENGLSNHPIIKHSVSNIAERSWRLSPRSGTRILTIGSISDAVAFTREYQRETLPHLDEIDLLSSVITDWERAGRDYDGINLTAQANEEVENSRLTHKTSFHTWDCESTFWFRWVFDSLASNGPVFYRSPIVSDLINLDAS